MREHAGQLDQLGIGVYAVTFESQSRVEEHQSEDDLPFPLLRDPGRKAYQRFGLGRQPAMTIWGPSTLLYYARQLLRGQLPNRAEGADQYQLGGDVLLNPDGNGGTIYRSANPADRPSVESILRQIRKF